MQVISYPWPRDQKEHKGHNKAEVQKGQICFAIEHDGRFFSYAYLDKDYAQTVMGRLDHNDTNMLDLNFRDQPIFVTSRNKD